MFLDGEDLGFGMDVVYWGHFQAAGGGAEGGVLYGLELFDVAGGSVGEPDGACVCEE